MFVCIAFSQTMDFSIWLDFIILVHYEPLLWSRGICCLHTNAGMHGAPIDAIHFLTTTFAWRRSAGTMNYHQTISSRYWSIEGTVAELFVAILCYHSNSLYAGVKFH